VLDGFLREQQLGAAKVVIDSLLERLNRGERLSPAECAAALADYAA
jgi:hypothetical protein